MLSTAKLMLCFNFNNRFTKTIVNFIRHFCCRVVAKQAGAYASDCLRQRTSYEVVSFKMAAVSAITSGITCVFIV